MNQDALMYIQYLEMRCRFLEHLIWLNSRKPMAVDGEFWVVEVEA